MEDYTSLLYGENLEHLKNHPSFLGLSEQEIYDFITFAKPTIFDIEPEQSVMLTPDAKRKLGVVIEGNITVFAIDYDGNRTVVDVVDKHGSVGPMLFMLDYYNMLFELSTDVTSRVVLFDPDSMLQTREEVAALQHRIIVNLLEYERRLFISLSEHLVCLSQKNIRDKIMRYLFIRSSDAHAYEFDIPLSREEMAVYLAVDRASLSRSLSELKSDGIIDFRKKHFKILDTKCFKY